MALAKPFLKWVGGKTQLLPALFQVFPTQCGTYYEPFLGGGAVFFAMASGGRFRRAVLNDRNEELINAYRMVQNFSDNVGEILQNWRVEYLKDIPGTYAHIRDQINPVSPIERAARTIFLNKTGFNGLYRVNRKGKFNVPVGKFKTPPAIYDRDALRACHEALDFRKVVLQSGDFHEVVRGAVPGDLVYFDPPYVPLSDSANFTSYTSDGFTLNDQQRLAETFRELYTKGVSVFLSNHDTPIVRDLYQGFDIITVPARRSVNSDASKRGPVNEVIVSAPANEDRNAVSVF